MSGLPSVLDISARNASFRDMEVPLTPEQEAFIRQAVASGRYRTAEDAIGDALRKWESEERNRAELLAALDEGEGDLESGHYTDFTETTLPQLADEMKRDARARRGQSS